MCALAVPIFSLLNAAVATRQFLQLGDHGLTEGIRFRRPMPSRQLQPDAYAVPNSPEDNLASHQLKLAPRPSRPDAADLGAEGLFFATIGVAEHTSVLFGNGLFRRVIGDLFVR